jgi:uncharacterized repeat protein (TIGR03803 family)
MDSSGNLYGTSYEGGAYNAGAVFALISNTAKTTWTQTVLWSFKGPPDAAGPSASMIMDKSGNLYGTTFSGGMPDEAGAIFELKINAAKTAWTETVLYRFCSVADCADGAQPIAALIMDKAGNLYGTTSTNGLHGEGTAFELSSP